MNLGIFFRFFKVTGSIFNLVLKKKKSGGRDCNLHFIHRLYRQKKIILKIN
jgi:hypothetical protein